MRRLILCLALPIAACGEREQPLPAPLVETITIGGLGGSVDAGVTRLTGTVRAPVESDLGFRVNGIMTRRLVERGQSVVRGQVLAIIDPGDLRLTAASLRSQQLAADRDAAAASANATSAAAEESRLRGLDTAGAIAPLAYEKARETAQSTGAQARAARARAASVASEARLAADQAGYATLRAPMAGVVADLLAEPGQVVTAGAPIIRLAGGGSREAEVFVPEAALAGARSAASATLFVGGRPSPARLRELSQAADPVTRTYRARYMLTGPAAAAPLGATVTIALDRPTSSETAGAIRVPLGAIVRRDRQAAVFTVGADLIARRVPVQVVSLGSDTATVVGRLPANTRVVRFGGFLLKPGQQVRVARANTGA